MCSTATRAADLSDENFAMPDLVFNVIAESQWQHRVRHMVPVERRAMNDHTGDSVTGGYGRWKDRDRWGRQVDAGRAVTQMRAGDDFDVDEARSYAGGSDV